MFNKTIVLPTDSYRGEYYAYDYLIGVIDQRYGYVSEETLYQIAELLEAKEMLNRAREAAISKILNLSEEGLEEIKKVSLTNYRILIRIIEILSNQEGEK